MSIPKPDLDFKTLSNHPYIDIALMIVAIFLAGYSGFLLGLSTESGGKGDIQVREVDLPGLTLGAYAERQKAVLGDNMPAADISIVVASKNGSKYYRPDCGGVGRIKEENKIYFPSSEEAKAAGYEPAANCKGLQ